MSPARKAIFIAAIVGVASGTASLGRWQLRRLAARKANNAVLRTAEARPPLQLPDDLAPGMIIDSGRRLVARGHFDTAGQVLLRGRAEDEGPGLQIATPFQLDQSDTILWVLRGFVHSPDATTPPDTIASPAAGTVTITGPAAIAPALADGGHPLLHNGTTTWQRLDRATLARRRPHSLAAYLILSGDASGPGRLLPVPPAELTNGPHLSYAIQWFGITLAVVVFGILMLWRDGHAPPPRHEAP